MQFGPFVLREEIKKRRLLKAAKMFRPSIIARHIFRFAPVSYATKVQFNAVDRPNLAYGVYAAALQAKALGLPGITVIEFGVGLGGGLRALDQHAEMLGKHFGLKIDAFGFDRGEGLAETQNPFDLPYWFKPSLFQTDLDAIQRNLRGAKIIAGDVSATIEDFKKRLLRYPVGFISFDLDFYTSTVDAFQVFDVDRTKKLPRVLCYFDDIFGISDLTIMGKCVGERRAIADFNSTHASKRQVIEKVDGLRTKRPISADWYEMYYAYHDFDHPLYNVVLNPL